MDNELTDYTGLSISNLYDKGSGNRRDCIWKLGDMVRTPDNIRSRDSGCYGKIVDIKKEVINEPNSSSHGDSYWLCYFKITGPNSKSNMIDKIIGYRDYCLLPYIPYIIKSNFSKNDQFGKSFEIGVTEGTHIGVFDSEGDCIYEGNSKEDCIDYCNKNNFEYKLKSNFSERIRKIFK